MTATKTPPEVIEKWREEFEIYCDSLEHKIPVVKNNDGKYTFFSTRGLFDCWIAARQSLVIELPAATTLDAQFYFVEMTRDIRTQGYRVEVKS